MKIRSRTLLRIALQVIGVLTILSGVSSAFVNWGSLVSLLFNHQAVPWPAIVGPIFVPIVILTAGLYLLINPGIIVGRFYPDQEEQTDTMERLFILAIKIAGIWLIVNALPDAVQIITNLLYILNVGPVIEVSNQIYTIISRLGSAIVNLLIGWYLLSGGKIFVKIAFPDDHQNQNSEL